MIEQYYEEGYFPKGYLDYLETKQKDFLEKVSTNPKLVMELAVRLSDPHIGLSDETFLDGVVKSMKKRISNIESTDGQESYYVFDLDGFKIPKGFPTTFRMTKPIFEVLNTNVHYREEFQKLLDDFINYYSYVRGQTTTEIQQHEENKKKIVYSRFKKLKYCISNHMIKLKNKQSRIKNSESLPANNKTVKINNYVSESLPATIIHSEYPQNQYHPMSQQYQYHPMSQQYQYHPMSQQYQYYPMSQQYQYDFPNNNNDSPVNSDGIAIGFLPDNLSDPMSQQNQYDFPKPESPNRKVSPNDNNNDNWSELNNDGNMEFDKTIFGDEYNEDVDNVMINESESGKRKRSPDENVSPSKKANTSDYDYDDYDIDKYFEHEELEGGKKKKTKRRKSKNKKTKRRRYYNK